MTTKEQILEILSENTNTHISGQELAAILNISRNSVWKAVKALQKLGYNISASTNKGYQLVIDDQSFSPVSIKRYLNKNLQNLDIEIIESIDSTNVALKALAQKGNAEGKILIANEQTAGRGRMGRSFYSPNASGVYLSILLRPDFDIKFSTLLTTAAAVSTALAIEAVSDKKAQIKWVNDVYINNKKACGILTEAAVSLENNGIEYAIVGIGINLSPPENGFPSEFKATSVYESKPDNSTKSKLTAQIINNFFDLYANLEQKEFIEEYRKRLFFLGKIITVIRGDKVFIATALDIDDDCHLLIRNIDGTTEYLSSGEISIRL